LSKGINSCSNQSLHRTIQPKDTIYIGWKRRPDGWIEFNNDGTCKGGEEIAWCGSLLHNSKGRWIKGYIRNIGVCDALHAEMWGMYLGLDMTRKERTSHSKILLDMVIASLVG